MKKEQYVDLLKSKPWEEIDRHFGDFNNVEPNYITKIKINSQQWIDFSVDHFDNALQLWEHQKPYNDDISNWLVEKNIKLGRKKDNTLELSYGVNKTSEEILKEILGSDNIKSLNLDKKNLSIRLIINFPGNGIAWHFDNAGRYKQKFKNVNFEKDKVVRYWFPVTDWYYGQVFQIGPKVLSHWQSGDVWNIPFGVPHGSMNFGYNIKYTVAITGTVI